MTKQVAAVAALMLSAAAGRAEDINGIIVQFNGKAVGGVESSTKVKDFKPVFEKDLQKIAAGLPGKVEVKLTSWFTIINGGSLNWTGGDKGTAEKLKAGLEKLPYVKMVELDKPVPPPLIRPER